MHGRHTYPCSHRELDTRSRATVEHNPRRKARVVAAHASDATPRASTLVAANTRECGHRLDEHVIARGRCTRIYVCVCVPIALTPVCSRVCVSADSLGATTHFFRLVRFDPTSRYQAGPLLASLWCWQLDALFAGVLCVPPL